MPSAGLIAFCQVVCEMEVLTIRTDPSPSPTRMPPLLGPCSRQGLQPLFGVGLFCGGAPGSAKPPPLIWSELA